MQNQDRAIVPENSEHISQLVLEHILREAQKLRASKIHIEPTINGNIVRFRIDGVLHDYLGVPVDSLTQIALTIKMISNLDIQEIIIPQDGFMKFNDPGMANTYVVSIIPGLTGDKVCITPYHRVPREYYLDKLGLECHQLELIRDTIGSSKPGLVIVAGPTNSGKSTTIYSALMEMRKRNYTIATVEWEQRANLPGVHQVVIDPDQGLTFEAVGRTYLNADIDVMFISELSDYATSELAFKAVLDRNKYVFAGMHCNDAISTIRRLENMCIEPWIIAEGVSIIQGQRLLRCLCQHCKEEAQITQEILVKASMTQEEARNTRVFRRKGCPECGNTGYYGMILAAETLQMTENFTQRMFTESGNKLKKIAVEEGMITMRQSALGKMREGLTSLDEVLLRTPSDEYL